VIDRLTVAVIFEFPEAGMLQASSERPLSFVARETHDAIRIVMREG
jgi:hypothetical protein